MFDKMSRIGNRILRYSDDISVILNKINEENQEVTVKGPLGEIKHNFKTNVKIVLDENDKSVKVEPKSNDKFTNSYYGTVNSIINGMLIGVKNGYQKELNIKGVGYKAQLVDKKIKLIVGFSHPVLLEIPEHINVEIIKDTKIIIKGFDKEKVSQFAAKIYLIKKPEPYGGKGIMYKDQHIRRKAGKSTGGKK